jgi:hypothetical protein
MLQSFVEDRTNLFLFPFIDLKERNYNPSV